MGDQTEGQDVQANQDQGQQQGGSPTAEDFQRQIKALTEKNQELLGALRKSKDVAGDSQKKLAENEAAIKKLNELAKILGIDPVKEDPETIRQRREAEARAREVRATKIERAVLMGLNSLGKALPAEVQEMVILKATNDTSIGLDEAGSPTGVKEFLDKVLPHFTNPGTVAAMPKPAAPVGGQGAIGDTVLAEVKTLADLYGRGPTFVEDFRSKYPERFKQLQMASSAALKSPTGLRLQMPNAPTVIRG